MKMTIVEGIVLKERPVGEQDKFIDILTREKGIIELSVKGARKINGKSSSSTQLFAYSRFCYDKRGERLYLNSAEPLHIFYGIRNSLTALSLAGYFAEVLRFCVSERADSGNVLRLMLNSLHFLENGTRTEQLLKSIFELRLMSDIGFMPDVLACRECGTYEPDKLHFSVNEGYFLCDDCFDVHGGDGFMTMNLPVLSAIRHIVLADFDRLFNFRLSEQSGDKLAEFSELYLTTHLEKNFKTLDFYRSLLSGQI